MLFAADGIEINYLTPEEIQAWQPYTAMPPENQRNQAFINRLQNLDLWTPEQIAGRRWPVGCVS